MDLGAGKPGSCPVSLSACPHQPASSGSQRFLRTQDRAEPSGWPGPWGPMEGGSLGGGPRMADGSAGTRALHGFLSFSAATPGPRCRPWGEMWGHRAGSERPCLPATIPPRSRPAAAAPACLGGPALPSCLHGCPLPPQPSSGHQVLPLCALAVVSCPGRGKAWH